MPVGGDGRLGAVTERPIELLFVYGTLMPGHLRWPMLEPHARRWGPVEVAGELWDTGRGWPAARFCSSGALVPGWSVRFAPAALAALLPVLDEMEGIGDPPDPSRDPYRRVLVDLPGAEVAWAYHATRLGDGWRRIERWAAQPEL